jgi:hypothetical protein
MAEVAEGLAQLLKDTIPAIPTDAATRAKSGRRGLPMGPGVRAYLLWTRRPGRRGRPLPLRMQAAMIVLPVTTG